ncbi:MAG: RDD family protein [Patulibacter sp.]
MPDRPEPPPSIYTRLDGTPLPQAPRPPQPATANTQPPAGWSGDTPPLAAGQQFVLATWPSRLGAYLLDGLLFGTLAWLLMVPVGVALGLTVSEAAQYFARLAPLPESIADPAPFYAAFAVQALIPGIALAIALCRGGGQTPGKRVAGIRVVRADGQPIDWRTALLRELTLKTIALAAVALVTLFLGWVLNFLWPLWDREHRAGHDFAARTRVVQWPKGR